MQAVSDEQLIEWVANGDSSCLGTLFERYHSSIYQFCLRMTRNPGYAEDITQEVFLRVLKKARSFRNEGIAFSVDDPQARIPGHCGDCVSPLALNEHAQGMSSMETSPDFELSQNGYIYMYIYIYICRNESYSDRRHRP